MTKTVNIKPVGDYIVINPATMKPLAADGERVEWSNYWQRRVNEGAVVEIPEKKGGK